MGPTGEHRNQAALFVSFRDGKTAWSARMNSPVCAELCSGPSKAMLRAVQSYAPGRPKLSYAESMFSMLIFNVLQM